ncbi:hypothetical protein ZWY2020_048868 [Hordeum vulgare]|nr:hypothetical protein ZWY2020_048868 [Hordeum vulgare]
MLVARPPLRAAGSHRLRVEPRRISEPEVYELHRVYRVQRDLMKQHHSREMHACSTLEDASQRNSPSQIPAHGANRIGTAPLNNEKSHSSKFPREGSVQSSPNGFPSSEAALPTKQGRFDLELGAEHYIEDDHASDKKAGTTISIVMHEQT